MKTKIHGFFYLCRIKTYLTDETYSDNTDINNPRSTQATPARIIETKSDGKIRIAFWNIENLFDTINAPASADNEFTPAGRYRWNTEKYNRKTEHIRQVINTIRPDIMGLCEVENSDVIQDILPKDYSYIHYDSPDIRGIDVALIYNHTKIKIIASEPIKTDGYLPTRDLLWIEAATTDTSFVRTRGNETRVLTLIVAHLPSRRGNNPKASALRREITQKLDSLSSTADPIIVMGDFNQNPSKNLLHRLYNTTAKAFHQGKGSYAYRDRWNMYDQIFVSNQLLTEVTIHSQRLIQNRGRFRGYPSKGNPSDHLPIYIDIPAPKHQ